MAELSEDLNPLFEAVMKLLPEDFDLESRFEEAGSQIGPNVKKLLEDMMRMSLLKPFGYGSGRVDIEGDTCIIYFDGFKEDLTRPESFYTKLPTKDDLETTLGFLSNDGEVGITYRDLLNKNYCTEYYHVDTNPDGQFDDADGYGGQYDFYILTTGSSYSCGTAFPYFAQKENLAKIIGEKPGGGDCVVASYVDAYGHVGATPDLSSSERWRGYVRIG